MIKFATIVGARPQFIKAAAGARAARMHNGRSDEPTVTEILIHTGQHYDHNMSRAFFDELEIPEPAYNLGVSQATHAEMTGRMLEKIEAVLVDEAPDAVIVYGDTNTTLAGALAAMVGEGVGRSCCGQNRGVGSSQLRSVGSAE